MRNSKKTKQITVIVGLVLKDNKILMVKRHEPELKDVHLKWEFPGGKIEFGETAEEAIVREIKEETGVLVKVKRILPVSVMSKWNYDWGIQQTIIFGAECLFISEATRSKDYHVRDIEWVSIDEVMSRDNLPGAKEFLESLSS